MCWSIPIQAVGKRKMKDKMTESIFVVESRKAILREVQMGISSDTEIEVVSGINEGDTIVVGPYRVLSKLKDGTRVNLTTTSENKSSK